MHSHRKSKFLASACAAFAIAATTVGCAPAQTMSTPVASTQAPASSVGIEGPALWRVADEDTTIYVFGTVHALPDDVNWYSGTVKNALDSSDTLVTEIDMTPAAEAETAALFQRTATLPAGTLSGAPKIRAMEIIDELEPVKRGVYGGAVGYLSFNGNMDTAIAIRTAVIKDNTLHIQAGAGVVADSIPRLEWKETMNKGRAIFRAVAMTYNDYDH